MVLPVFVLIGCDPVRQLFLVAFCADDLAKPAVSISVNSESLLDILSLIPGLKFPYQGFVATKTVSATITPPMLEEMVYF